MKNILVTGGMGFIWSHTVVALIEAGYQPIIFDNLSNSSTIVLDNIQKITGVSVPFLKGDIRNKDDLSQAFSNNTIDSVIHFAALKSVGESCAKPWLYYDNNIGGTINLLNAMEAHNITKIIFSWSATVYGDTISPITEDHSTGDVTNPYGMTKRLCEKLLEEKSHFSNLQAISLRYFNPIGAHPSWLIGEHALWTPNNIFPYIMKVVWGELPNINVFGNDYSTPDGTGVRDYIDIIDLATGHIAALNYLSTWNNPGFDAINIGTWKWTSVLELIATTAHLAWKDVPYVITQRRDGDIAQAYAAVEKAKKILWWEAKYTIEDSIRNSLKFNTNKPTWIS